MSEYLDGGPQKTRETFWLHFVCGFVAGGLVGFRFAGRHFGGDSIPRFLLVVLACAIVVGFLAGRYLDQFWHGLSDWLRWW